VTLLVEQYLPKPTYRRLSVTALKRAHLVPPGVDAGRAASAAVDAAIERALPTTAAVEDELMRALVGMSCREAKSALSKVKEIRRTVLRRIPPLHYAGYEEIQQSGRRHAPPRLLEEEVRLRHRIRQELRRCLPKQLPLARLATLHLQSAHQNLVDEANRLTLAAITPSLGLTVAEQLAFRFFRLRRCRPASTVGGYWFDGVIADHPLLDGLVDLCPSVFRRLAVTSFFRAWPPELQPVAEEDLRRRIGALLAVSRLFLSEVRTAERERKADKRAHHQQVDARSSRRASDIRFLHGNRKLLTARQRQVVALRTRGLSTAAIGQKLGITRQTVEIHLKDAVARARRRRK